MEWSVEFFFKYLPTVLSPLTPMTEVGVTKQDERREKNELKSWRREKEREREREKERSGGGSSGKIRLITLYAWLSPKWARDYYFPRV